MHDSISTDLRRRQVQAWGVHLFTASGAVWGFLALVAIVDHNWPLALAWMALAFLIDSLDGTLARRFRVKDVLPGFDGEMLDNMVDYFTYTIVPALFIFQAGLLPADWDLFGVSVMVLASAYQFAQGDAKTDGNIYFFKGFPSYWNVLAFYLLMLDMNTWANLGAVIVCALAVFVPIRYVYQSRLQSHRRLTLVISLIWGTIALITVVTYPQHPKPLLYLSFFYPIYYLGLSLYMMRRADRLLA